MAEVLVRTFAEILRRRCILTLLTQERIETIWNIMHDGLIIVSFLLSHWRRISLVLNDPQLRVP